jgi:hypothetical protein
LKIYAKESSRGEKSEMAKPEQINKLVDITELECAKTRCSNGSVNESKVVLGLLGYVLCSKKLLFIVFF